MNSRGNKVGVAIICINKRASHWILLYRHIFEIVVLIWIRGSLVIKCRINDDSNQKLKCVQINNKWLILHSPTGSKRCQRAQSHFNLENRVNQRAANTSLRHCWHNLHLMMQLNGLAHFSCKWVPWWLLLAFQYSFQWNWHDSTIINLNSHFY